LDVHSSIRVEKGSRMAKIQLVHPDSFLFRHWLCGLLRLCNTVEAEKRALHLANHER